MDNLKRNDATTESSMEVESQRPRSPAQSNRAEIIQTMLCF